MAQFFPHIGGSGCGWESHVNGAREYLQLRGSNSIQSGSELGRTLFNNVRHASVSCHKHTKQTTKSQPYPQTVQGLRTRKTLCFEQPQWLEATREASRTGLSSALTDLGVQVPGLLQAVDEFTCRGVASLEATELVQRLGRICSRLRQWRSRFESQDEPAYDVVPVSTLDGLPGYVMDGVLDGEAYAFGRFLGGHCGGCIFPKI